MKYGKKAHARKSKPFTDESVVGIFLELVGNTN